MDLDEFFTTLADGDSNDHEIDCLKTALRDAYDRLRLLDQILFEEQLPAILAGQ